MRDTQPQFRASPSGALLRLLAVQSFSPIYKKAGQAVASKTDSSSARLSQTPEKSNLGELFVLPYLGTLVHLRSTTLFTHNIQARRRGALGQRRRGDLRRGMMIGKSRLFRDIFLG